MPRPPLLTILCLLFCTSCNRSVSEPWHAYRTHSEVFNRLVASAPIDVVDLEGVVPDTLWTTPEQTFCHADDPRNPGIKDLRDFAILDDTTIVFVDFSQHKVARMDLRTGAISVAFGEGNGPGEVNNPSQVRVWGDEVVVSDKTFIHWYDRSLSFMGRIPNRESVLPFAKPAWSDSLYIHRGGTSEPEVLFYIRSLNEAENPVRHTLFEPIFDVELAGRYRLGYNGLQRDYNRALDQILFKFFQKPFLFISDLTGDIQRIIRLESDVLAQVDPDYNELNLRRSDGVASSHGDFTPVPSIMGPGDVIGIVRLLDNGDLFFRYRGEVVLLRLGDRGYEFQNSYVTYSSASGQILGLSNVEFTATKMIGSSIFSNCVYVFYLGEDCQDGEGCPKLRGY